MASLIDPATQLHSLSILNAINILQSQAELANLPQPQQGYSLLAAPALLGHASRPMDEELIMALNGSSFARQQQSPYPASQTNYPQFLPEEEVIRSLNNPNSPQQWPASLHRFLSNPCTCLGPSALSHPSLWVLPTGEFDYLLYNYLLMVTVDRRAATNGLRQRLPAIVSAQANPNPAAPFRGSSSNLTEPNNITWSTGSAGSGGSSTPSRREPRRGSSQSSQSSSESNECIKIVQSESKGSQGLSRDPSP